MHLGKRSTDFCREVMEPDLLDYGSSKILVAQKGSTVLGGVRVAKQVDASAGILTDLVADDDIVAARLIGRGEKHLKGVGVKKVHGVVLDGRGMVRYFYRTGYKPVRRTVRLVWDLALLTVSVEEDADVPFRIVRVRKPDVTPLASFIASSYQPYWTWWKECGNPQEAIENRLRLSSAENACFWLAYHKEKLVGVADALVPGSSDSSHPPDTFQWGIALSKDHPGGKIGSALLVPALQWLKEKGLQKSQLTVTSGLDDYDPVVYLATLSTGAVIESEFIVLQKILR